MRRLLPLFALILFVPLSAGAAMPQSMLAALVFGQSDDEERDPAEGRRVERTPTMREDVYRRLAEAQEAAEADNLARAFELVSEVRNLKGLSSYETAQAFNFLAYLHYAQGDYTKAISAYESVLGQEDIPQAMETQTTFTLAQLNFAEENYRKAEDYLRRWINMVDKPTPESYMLLGQILYSQERYQDALKPVDQAISMVRQAGDPVKEEWLLLLRVLHYELENFAEVAKILEELVDRFPKKEYWLQLSGIYGELEKPEQRTITLELAYKQGFLDKETEYVNLASLLLQMDIPYRASKVLEDGMEKGIIERDVKNLRLLAQAYMLAQEEDKAIAPLKAAAQKSPDGDLFLQLANIYVNQENYSEAVSAARQALDRNLDEKGDAHFLLGMALYSQDKLSDAEQAFRQAARDRGNQQMARQWLNYIEKERDRREQLAAATES